VNDWQILDSYPWTIKMPYGAYTKLWYGGYSYRRYWLPRRLLNLCLWHTFEIYL
jgi:hypothetical protein